jgi:hypothetical protein
LTLGAAAAIGDTSGGTSFMQWFADRRMAKRLIRMDKSRGAAA